MVNELVVVKVAKLMEDSSKEKYGLSPLEEVVTSPVSVDIRIVVLPSKFQVPQIAAYDGKIDARTTSCQCYLPIGKQCH